MKKFILGDRKGKPAHINLYMKMRMGDLASTHTLMGDWRRRNPDRRLTVFYDPNDPIHEYSRQIPIDWVFEGIADEVWVKESPSDPVFLPGEETFNLFHGERKTYIHLWAWWREQMRNITFTPTIRPPERIIEKAEAIKKEYGLPDKFALIQVLFEAGYHKYRNAPINWWLGVAHELNRMGVPTAVIGPTRWMKDVTSPPGVFPLYKTVSNPFESMGLITKSSVFVGGETGLPLWAGIFKVPVVATFKGWQLRDEGRSGKGLEYRPISYGAPVVYSLLEGPMVTTAEVIRGVFSGETTMSTPVSYKGTKGVK